MTREEISSKIEERFPGLYPDVNIMVDKIEAMDGDLKMRVEKFLAEGVVDDIEIEGYSVAKLKEQGLNELAAFGTLDWLKREPEKAKKSLEKGHDFVGPQ